MKSLFFRWIVFCMLTSLLTIIIWEWANERLSMADKLLLDVYVWVIIVFLTMLLIGMSIAYTISHGRNVKSN